jgi:hypothetical protein
MSLDADGISLQDHGVGFSNLETRFCPPQGIRESDFCRMHSSIRILTSNSREGSAHLDVNFSLSPELTRASWLRLIRFTCLIKARKTYPGRLRIGASPPSKSLALTTRDTVAATSSNTFVTTAGSPSSFKPCSWALGKISSAAARTAGSIFLPRRSTGFRRKKAGEDDVEQQFLR